MVLFFNECLFINYLFFKIRKFATFDRNFHLLSQFHRNKHLKNTATFWKSSSEIRNFRPQLSQNIFFQKAKKINCSDKSCTLWGELLLKDMFRCLVQCTVKIIVQLYIELNIGTCLFMTIIPKLC